MPDPFVKKGRIFQIKIHNAKAAIIFKIANSVPIHKVNCLAIIRVAPKKSALNIIKFDLNASGDSEDRHKIKQKARVSIS